MNVFNELSNDIRVLEDKSYEYEEKLYALSNLLLYVSGLDNVSDYLCAILKCMSDEFDSGNLNSHIMRNMLAEIRKILCIPENINKVNIVIGQNWLAQAVSELLQTDGEVCICEEYFNWKYCDQKNVKFLICEENAIKKECLKQIPNDDVIYIYELIKAEILNAPQLKKIVRKFQKGCEDKKTECIISGLSYGRDAVHCDLVNVPTLTLANSSQDLYYDYLCLQYACDRLSKLRYAVNIIAPYSLRWDESMSSLKDDNVLYYYTVFGDTHHNTNILERVRNYSEEKSKADSWFIRPWTEYSDRIYDDYYAAQTVCLDHSRDVFEPSRVKEDEINRICKQYQKPYEKTVVEYKNLLCSYCLYCKERGIKILFIMPPYSNYYKSLWKNEYVDEMLEFLEWLKENYNIEYINMSCEKFPDYCFWDSGHVNRIGALYVSEKINAWIKNIR